MHGQIFFDKDRSDQTIEILQISLYFHPLSIWTIFHFDKDSDDILSSFTL